MTPRVRLLEGHTPQGRAGTLVHDSQHVWRYETQDLRCEIGLGLPLRAASYNSTPIHALFAMNLPEGEQFFRLTQRYEKQFSRFDDMAILSLVGANQIGRVSLRPPGAPETSARGVGLAEILRSQAGDGLFEHLVETYLAAGIAGVQPKVLVPDADLPLQGRETARTPDLIVKTGGAEYPHLAANEYLCMSVAQAAGMEVPEFHLSQDASLFVIRRFDLDPAGGRLGFEDFAALSNAGYDRLGRYKYRGSYEGIARVAGLYVERPAASLQHLFALVALSCLVRNGDAHLKNFGLIYTHPRDAASVRLAPAYDLVTTQVYESEDRHTGRMLSDRTLALKLGRSNRYPTRADLERFGREHCLVARPGVVIERLREAMEQVWRAHAELLPEAFRQRMRRVWREGQAAYVGAG